jgi:hypothetical protein
MVKLSLILLALALPIGVAGHRSVTPITAPGENSQLIENYGLSR